MGLTNHSARFRCLAADSLLSAASAKLCKNCLLHGVAGHIDFDAAIGKYDPGVDSSSCAAAALYILGDGAADTARDAPRPVEDADRHIPGDRHSGHQHRVDLHGAVGPGGRQPDHVGQRTQPDHAGQRHRAHRIRVAGRLLHHQDLLSEKRQHRHRHRAGGLCRRVAAAPIAARHPAATGPQVLRIEHSHHPARRVEHHAA